MSKINLIAIYTLLLLIHIGSAETKICAKFGMNNSSLRTTGSDSQLGSTMSFSVEPEIYRRLFLGIELQRSIRRTVLHNKIIGGTYVGPYYLYDIHYQMEYFQLNLLLKYSQKLNKKVEFQPFYGAAMVLGWKDRSKNNKKELLGYVQKMQDWDNIYYDYQYYTGDFGPLHPVLSSGLAICVGFSIHWSSFFIECRYQNDFFNIEVVDTTTLNERAFSVDFLLGMDLHLLSKLFES